MRKQNLVDGSFEKIRKKTCKGPFLDDMEQIIPWQNLCVAIESYYPKPENTGRRPVGIDLGQVPVPDETTIPTFRHLMECHNPGGKLFRFVNVYLEESEMKVARGTIVDATIINTLS